MPKLDCFSPEKIQKWTVLSQKTPKLDYFSPEKNLKSDCFIPKIQNWTVFIPEKSKCQSRFIQKSPKMDVKVIKNYQVISFPRLSTSEPYRMPSSRLSHPLRNRLCDGLLFTNRS